MPPYGVQQCLTLTLTLALTLTLPLTLTLTTSLTRTLTLPFTLTACNYVAVWRAIMPPYGVQFDAFWRA